MCIAVGVMNHKPLEDDRVECMLHILCGSVEIKGKSEISFGSYMV